MPDARGTTSDARFGVLVTRLGRSGMAEATAATLLLLYSEAFFRAGPGTLTWAQFAADVSLCLGAAASGRWPRAGGVAAGVALMAFPFVHAGAVPAAILATMIPLFATGARGLERWRTALTLWYFLGLAWVTLPLAPDPGVAAQTIVVWIVLIALAWTLGTVLRRFQLRTLALQDERVTAVRAQRRSIARDLHDTVAYATTTMIMRAEQIKLRGDADPQLNADLDFIIATGRRSLRDLRGMMEALRRNDPFLEAEGGAAAPWRIVSPADLLTQQVAELRAHGLTVQTQVDADLDALPESVRETLGKLVVEATSNMVKHAARPGPCRIIIEQTPDSVEAVFTNPVGATASGARGGYGLVGMRERVEALGGDFETTTASGAWLLRVSLPVAG